MRWISTFFDQLTEWGMSMVGAVTQYKTSYLATLIGIVFFHSFLLVWAFVNSFVYLGCLDNELLCPHVYVGLPGSEMTLAFIPEWPYLLLVIILSAINITLLFTFQRPTKVIYVLLATCATIFVLSSIFVYTRIDFESAVMNELQRMQRDSVQ